MQWVTPALTRGCRSSRLVMKSPPVGLADVVTTGVSIVVTYAENQWSGMRTESVSFPWRTLAATASLFLRLSMRLTAYFLSLMVMGPPSFSTHSFASGVTSQFSYTHSLLGAMTLNGCSVLFLSSRTFSTSASLVASQPMP